MPQLENGYLKIANELFDALIRHRIPGEQRQCFDFIIRKTYGFNKKEDQISNSQFVEATGLKPGNVSRSVKSLVQKKIVIKNDKFNPPKYCINKHYKQWQGLSKAINKGLLSKTISPVITSDNIKSDKNQEVIKQVNSHNSVETRTCKDQENNQNQENGLLSKVMDTKDSNNVTKNRGGAEGAEKANHKKIKRWRDLKKIIGGSREHTLVSKYAVECGIAGVSFEELISWAQRKLKEIEQDN
jgi:phage replication O-like protein O